MFTYAVLTREEVSPTIEVRGTPLYLVMSTRLMVLCLSLSYQAYSDIAQASSQAWSSSCRVARVSVAFFCAVLSTSDNAAV